MFVKMKSPHALRPGRLEPMTLQQTWAGGRSHWLDRDLVFPHLADNLFAAIEEIQERRVDLSQGKMGKPLGDFFRRPAVNLGLGVDVLNTHSRAGNERAELSCTIGAEFNVRSNGLAHVPIMPQRLASVEYSCQVCRKMANGR